MAKFSDFPYYMLNNFLTNSLDSREPTESEIDNLSLPGSTIVQVNSTTSNLYVHNRVIKANNSRYVNLYIKDDNEFVSAKFNIIPRNDEPFKDNNVLLEYVKSDSTIFNSDKHYYTYNSELISTESTEVTAGEFKLNNIIDLRNVTFISISLSGAIVPITDTSSVYPLSASSGTYIDNTAWMTHLYNNYLRFNGKFRISKQMPYADVYNDYTITNVSLESDRIVLRLEYVNGSIITLTDDSLYYISLRIDWNQNKETYFRKNNIIYEWIKQSSYENYIDTTPLYFRNSIESGIYNIDYSSITQIYISEYDIEKTSVLNFVNSVNKNIPYVAGLLTISSTLNESKKISFTLNYISKYNSYYVLNVIDPIISDDLDTDAFDLGEKLKFQFIPTSKLANRGSNGQDKYVNLNLDFLYFGKIYRNYNSLSENNYNYYSIDYYGLKDYYNNLVPDNNLKDNFKWLMETFFDVIYLGEVYNRQKNIVQMINPMETFNEFLYYIGKIYAIDTYLNLDEERKRVFLRDIIHFLKRKGTYNAAYIVWKLIGRSNLNTLNVYERWHDYSFEGIPINEFEDYHYLLYYKQDITGPAGDSYYLYYCDKDEYPDEPNLAGLTEDLI